MSLSFRIFSLPRSGSAWVANWLTGCHSICWHDPLFDGAPEDVEKWANRQQRLPGIACTAWWMLEDKHPEIPTICLQRGLTDIQSSLLRLSLPTMSPWAIQRFNQLPFEFVTLRELFNPAKAERIHNYLLPDVPFDAERHKHLSRWNVQVSGYRIDEARILADVMRGIPTESRKDNAI